MVNGNSPFYGIPKHMRAIDLQIFHDIIHVPQIIYQGMADIVHATGYDPTKKYKVINYLQDWVEEAYPGKTMGLSIELSRAEAKELEPRISGIEYGVYVKLIPRDLQVC